VILSRDYQQPPTTATELGVRDGRDDCGFLAERGCAREETHSGMSANPLCVNCEYSTREALQSPIESGELSGFIFLQVVYSERVGFCS
jgi:hypothetical protein